MQKVLIVCHDAGGAEILAHFVLANSRKRDFFVCLAGPAKKIFQNRCPDLPRIALRDLIKKYKRKDIFVLTGTSVRGNLEKRAIALTKKHNIKCASFLDHWVNYQQRFLPTNKKKAMLTDFLPNEVWVGDRYAFNIALKNGFPKAKLKLIANPLFARAKSQSKKAKPSDRQKTIIYLSEHLLSQQERTLGWQDNAWQKNGQQRLILFLKDIEKRKDIKEVIVRLHPAEKARQYQALVKTKHCFALAFSKEFDIIKDIQKADEVYGVRTMALVLALLMKKNVFSFLPKRYKLELPFLGIKRYELK